MNGTLGPAGLVQRRSHCMGDRVGECVATGSISVAPQSDALKPDSEGSTLMRRTVQLCLLSVAAALLLFNVSAPTVSARHLPGLGLDGYGNQRRAIPTTGDGTFSQGDRPTKRFGEDLEKRVTEHVLANGMTFIILERHTDPTFAGVIRFNAGSVDEGPGRTGLAHMFEHMAFKGTDIIGTSDYEKERAILEEIEKVSESLSVQSALGLRADSALTVSLEARLDSLHAKVREVWRDNEYIDIYFSAGGDEMNAYTSVDWTVYTATFPSNKLEFWMLMESERIQHPVFRGFDLEKGVVTDERRLSFESEPVSALWEMFTATAFTASPLRHPIIGWSSDLACLTAADARRFHETYYGPQNAVATIVGDVDAAEVVRLAEAYFGDIPQRDPPPPVRTKEPQQKGPKRVWLETEARPYLIMGYKKPSAPHPDDTVFAVVASVLGSGRACRFDRHLVLDRQVAKSVDVSHNYPGERVDTNLFVIDAYPLEPYGLEELEEAVLAELDSLKASPVSDEELHRIRSSMEADYVFRQESNLGLALTLSYHESLTGDWRVTFRYVENMMRVTKQDIMRAARQYLVPSNMTVACFKGKESDQ